MSKESTGIHVEWTEISWTNRRPHTFPQWQLARQLNAWRPFDSRIKNPLVRCLNPSSSVLRSQCYDGDCKHWLYQRNLWDAEFSEKQSAYWNSSKAFNTWLWRSKVGLVFGTVGVPRDKAKSNFGNKNI